MVKRVAPNPYRSLRNAFFIHGIIKPYFDPGFDLSDFKEGARAAVQTVSDLLSKADFDSLEGLMEKSCFEDIKRRLSFTTAEQRQALKILTGNIVGDFVYEVGIMFNEDAAGERYVEITYVAHANTLLSSIDDIQGVKHAMDLHKRSEPMFLNYRFLRRYTRGQDPDSNGWIVSAVNHFNVNSS